jgi:hypothetical protein
MSDISEHRNGHERCKASDCDHEANVFAWRRSIICLSFDEIDTARHLIAALLPSVWARCGFPEIMCKIAVAPYRLP